LPRRSLLIQSIGSNPNDTFRRWMEHTEPLHTQYADRHGADFLFFAGEKDAALNPTWNRIPMFLDAFDKGYDKVVWLDADTLVIDQERSVFDETSDDAPLLMTRVLSSHFEFPWASEAADGNVVPADKWDVYNDGVLIANNSDHARACFEFVWANRHSEFKPWHVPGIPELDWILDYVYEHPDAVEQLSLAYNWMPYPEAPPVEEAVILAWHGMPHEVRWHGFTEALRHYYS
jgi:hypothetical protein